jgi:hypothetical protein
MSSLSQNKAVKHITIDLALCGWLAGWLAGGLSVCLFVSLSVWLSHCINSMLAPDLAQAHYQHN